MSQDVEIGCQDNTNADGEKPVLAFSATWSGSEVVDTHMYTMTYADQLSAMSFYTRNTQTIQSCAQTQKIAQGRYTNAVKNSSFSPAVDAVKLRNHGQSLHCNLQQLFITFRWQCRQYSCIGQRQLLGM